MKRPSVQLQRDGRYTGASPTGSRQDENGERLDELIRASGIDLSARLGELVMQELATGPVVPEVFADAKQAARARESDDFTVLGVAADAVLDITVNDYGFYCSSGVDDYTPQVSMP